jgi:DNA-3-methyladenine glycosylase II
MPRKRDALQHFKRVDPQFYTATKKHHPALPAVLTGKKTRAQLFASLVSTVISQQLGLAAAAAILSRVKSVCGGHLSPEALVKARPATLRTAGLSGAKIKTLKEIAKAVRNNSLDLLSLKKVSEEEAAEKLMSIWGLGPWSAEMFLMFALGRPDVFSPGDLGLIRAMETLYGLPKNAPHSSLLVIAEKWSPHRTYASLLLWRTRDK